MRMSGLVMMLVVAACGPSNTAIRAAKQAQYVAGPNQLLDVALQVTQRTYKIGAIDIEGRKFSTVSQWYSPEGGRISAYTEGSGEFVNAGGGDVQVTLVVQARQVDARTAMIVITPKTFQLVAGSPQPRELKPDDPNLPPWVRGRVDSLAVAIHSEGKKLFPAPQPAR